MATRDEAWRKNKMRKEEERDEGIHSGRESGRDKRVKCRRLGEVNKLKSVGEGSF